MNSYQSLMGEFIYVELETRTEKESLQEVLRLTKPFHHLNE